MTGEPEISQRLDALSSEDRQGCSHAKQRFAVVHKHTSVICWSIDNHFFLSSSEFPSQDCAADRIWFDTD